jgi:hypothetical protein
MSDEVSMKEIERHIYRIRGQHVMLDSDLAYLYGTSTKRLNEQVHRNLRRFPSDFMFQLSLQEIVYLRSHFATSNEGRGGRRYQPYVFTEEGVSMLSTTLNSERAIQVSIAIMRAFVKLRHAVLAHQGIARRVEKLEGKVDMHETDIRLLVQDIHELKNRPTKPKHRKRLPIPLDLT